MRILIQRVSKSAVIIDEKVFSEIKSGMLIFIGIEEADNEEDMTWMISKIVNLRIFNDPNKIPNLCAKDVNAEYMVVSQFTLHASVKKGNRPSYIKAARPEKAIEIYKTFIDRLTLAAGKKIQTGEFGADMQVEIVNDGPLTIWIDSKSRD